MPLSPDNICSECGKKYTSIGSSTKLCPSCLKKKRVQEKIDWLTQRRWNKSEDREATLEERIAWIEEWIYKHKDLAKKKILEDEIPF